MSDQRESALLLTKSSAQIANYIPDTLSQLLSVSSVKNICTTTEGKDTDAKDDTTTSVYDWRQEHIPYSKEIMIVASFGEVPTSQEDHWMPKRFPLDSQGSKQWMREELDLIQDLYRQDSECHLTLVCPEFPGTECSKDYYLERIKQLFLKCKQPGVAIWYTGHGEKNTGNWCFKDGVITFQDIFGLYMDCLRGKPLHIISDCSYSGKWVGDCIKTLDDLGIPSCGHYCKDQGILLKVYCSCRGDEEATALTYIKEGAEFHKEKYVAFWISNKTLTSGQRPHGTNFTKLFCRSEADKPCDISRFHTWEDRVVNGTFIYVVRGKDKGKAAWHYVLVDKDKVESFNKQIKTGNIAVTHYGKVLYSGWGQDPPKDITYKINLRFFCISPE